MALEFKNHQQEMPAGRDYNDHEELGYNSHGPGFAPSEFAASDFATSAFVTETGQQEPESEEYDAEFEPEDVDDYEPASEGEKAFTAKPAHEYGRQMSQQHAYEPVPQPVAEEAPESPEEEADLEEDVADVEPIT